MLANIKLTRFSLFEEILSVCSILLSKTLNKSAGFVISDEFYTACFNLLQSLFNNSDMSVLESFYKFKHLTSIGLLVSVLLDVLLNSSSLHVRIESLNAFKSLSLCSVHNKSIHVKLDSRIGMLFASFLPGTAIKLVQKFLLAQNLKLLNHKLICGVLEVLAHVITKVFDDRFLNETFAKEAYELCTTSNESISANVKSLIIDRAVNKEWTQTSSQKLFVLMERLLEALMPTDNYNVQLSLVKFSASIVPNYNFPKNKVFIKILF